VEFMQQVLGFILGSLYLILASFVGYNLLRRFLPGIFRVSKSLSLYGKRIRLENWMVTIPAGFLVGTMLMTWLTYLSSLVLCKTSNPLLFGNIISFSVFIVASVILFLANKKLEDRSIEKPTGNFISRNLIEIIFIFISFVAVTFFMFYTLYVKDGVINIGPTVASDFGPHLAVIRSFSYGSNFPTGYPHFADDGHIRYHFMFQFLTGNLEFLGMRLDFAFNIPSILSLIAFLMLFYSFIVMVMGERWVGIIAAVLFSFRSSFAFFTYVSDKLKEGIPFFETLKMLFDNPGPHIGRSSSQECWGLFAQNVYVNQRHLAFALGILFLILIAVYPMFRNMIGALKNARKVSVDEYNSQNQLIDTNVLDNEDNIIDLEKNSDELLSESPDETLNNKQSEQQKRSFGKIYFKNWINEFLIKRDAWLPKNVSRTISLGLILGLLTFWNGAVTIAALPILFILAIMSKRRLEYLGIAVLVMMLSYLQSFLFMGFGQSAVDPQLHVGFLATLPADLDVLINQYKMDHNYFGIISLIPRMIPPVMKYYVELLGILPIISLIAVFSVSKGKSRWISLLVIGTLCGLMYPILPDIAFGFKIFIMVITAVALLLANTLMNHPVIPKGGKWLALAFLTPWIIATTLQLNPDVPVNHKYVMISCILFDIIIANFLFRMFYKKPIAMKLVAGVLLFTLALTGIADIKTLYNMNKGNVQLRNNSTMLIWVKENTKKDDVFLTFAHSLHSIMLAGRKVAYGHPYYAWSAGYDTYTREEVLKQIYSSRDPETFNKLLKELNIAYFVVDNDMRREVKDLDEGFIGSVLEKAYSDDENETVFYKVN